MLALLGTALLESLLFGITAHDPRTFIAGTVLLTIIALIASVVPALQATRVDPARALSAE